MYIYIYIQTYIHIHICYPVRFFLTPCLRVLPRLSTCRYLSYTLVAILPMPHVSASSSVRMKARKGRPFDQRKRHFIFMAGRRTDATHIYFNQAIKHKQWERPMERAKRVSKAMNERNPKHKGKDSTKFERCRGRSRQMYNELFSKKQGLNYAFQQADGVFFWQLNV